MTGDDSSRSSFSSSSSLGGMSSRASSSCSSLGRISGRSSSSYSSLRTRWYSVDGSTSSSSSSSSYYSLGRISSHSSSSLSSDLGRVLNGGGPTRNTSAGAVAPPRIARVSRFGRIRPRETPARMNLSGGFLPYAGNDAAGYAPAGNRRRSYSGEAPERMNANQNSFPHAGNDASGYVGNPWGSCSGRTREMINLNRGYFFPYASGGYAGPPSMNAFAPVGNGGVDVGVPGGAQVREGFGIGPCTSLPEVGGSAHGNALGGSGSGSAHQIEHTGRGRGSAHPAGNHMHQRRMMKANWSCFVILSSILMAAFALIVFYGHHRAAA